VLKSATKSVSINSSAAAVATESNENHPYSCLF